MCVVPKHWIEDVLPYWREKANGLWFIGDLNLLKSPLVSVVGTRDVSQEGILRTRKLVSVLVRNGYCIVSGLASGVDTVAHKTTLDLGGETIAIMGTPINEIYPRENADLKEQIAEKGLVLSQFKPGSQVHRYNFPRRNDLMAMLSYFTIVVEASESSGTRHQVLSALKYGRRAAFVKSLADADVDWVNEAIKHRNSFVISDEEEFVVFINKLKDGRVDNNEQMRFFFS